ncbi:MAG: ABC transporter permease [Candidatus Eisenbacteria bacterium]|nr:ABC transporter permease [Candidatus Eisenbacteria bacterium]
MELRETMATAIWTLRTHRMRSGLTMLGIVIGAGALVAVMSLISGLNRSIAAQFQSIGTDIISVSIYPWVQMGDNEDFRSRKPITMADARAVGELPSIGLMAPNVHTRRAVSREGRDMRSILVSGTTPEYETIDNFTVEAGRFVTDPDVARRRPVAVIGADVADELFASVDPIGRQIRVGGKRFSVIGVLERKGKILGESLDGLVIIPITTLEKTFGRRRSVVIDCSPAEGVPIERAVEDIRQLLRARRHVPRDKPDDFAVNTQRDLMRSYQQITGVLFLAMVGIVSLALLVGGIGIMNVMLVSVAERTREIGVRMAIGARRRDIAFQFLIESIILTVLGGLVGIAGGAAIALLVKAVTPLPAAVTGGCVAIAVAFSVVTGILFGLTPARRAGRLNPIEALRYE